MSAETRPLAENHRPAEDPRVKAIREREIRSDRLLVDLGARDTSFAWPR
jgi:predicted small integral membrane protein